MTATVRIDMVADPTCPWSAIALFSLLRARSTLQADVQTPLHLQPLELYPGLEPGGVHRSQYLQQQAPTRSRTQPCWADIRLHGLAVGLDMGRQEPERLYNTLDAHRLLQWAHLHGSHIQLELAQKLVHAYFSQGADISNHQVLADLAASTGLHRPQTLAYLQGNEDAQAVREAESFYRGMGIVTVPTFIFNHRQLLRGNHPPEGFVRAIQHVAAATSLP